MDEETQAIINAMNLVRYGPRPFDPAVNTPQDVGLGGLSTEYLATSEDPYGQPFNYPQIWYDMYGQPHLMSEQDAYNQAVNYELASGERFPRYDTVGQASVAAENRSMMGGAAKGKLGSILNVAGY